MALNDGLRTPHRNEEADTRTGMNMLPVILGAVVVLALGWFFFGDRLMSNMTTRTSQPVTGSPTSGSSNPGTSKQP